MNGAEIERSSRSVRETKIRLRKEVRNGQHFYERKSQEEVENLCRARADEVSLEHVIEAREEW